MENITLEDGTTIGYNELNYKHEAEIIDLHQEMFHRGLPLSLELCNSIMLYTQVCTTKDLVDKKYTVGERYDIGGKLIGAILTPMITKAVDKKKLK